MTLDVEIVVPHCSFKSLVKISSHYMLTYHEINAKNIYFLQWTGRWVAFPCFMLGATRLQKCPISMVLNGHPAGNLSYFRALLMRF